ncbi:hypothetical protein GALL_488060 [mine drainage metagenome]|uniref:Uncharacterized protein n=1 Tax=mine drainage metagenome TaxID=410659 RepID=A0A1J5Q140_9ZZZZ
MEAFKVGRGVFAFEYLGVDPFGAYTGAIGHAAVGQRLGDGFVGVFKLGVFADDGDAHLAFGVDQTVHHVLPPGEVGTWRGGDAEGVKDGLVEPLAVIGERRVVDGFEVGRGDHRAFADVAEQGDFLALFVRDRVFRAQKEDVGRKANGLQLLDGVLGRLGFQLARGGEVGQQG